MKGPPMKGPPMKGPPIKGGKAPNLPALPGQPEIKVKTGPVPKGPTKRLNWKKVPNNKLITTVFKDFGDEEIPLEVDKLEELFSTKKKEEAKAEEHAKSKVINLIDLSRANNIGIMLNRLKRSPEDIKTAIIKMDAEFLNTGNLEALRKTLPNKDEIETLKNFEGDKLNVGYVEQYMFQIYDIPDLDKKIDQLLFKSTYGAKVAEIKVDLENVGKAIVEVRTSKLFIGLLKHILAIGNFLNYGSNTGSANGFSLEVIEKLKDTKGNKKRQNFIRFPNFSL